MKIFTCAVSLSFVSVLALAACLEAALVKDISTGIDDTAQAKVPNNSPDTDYVIGQGSFMSVGAVPIARDAPLPNVFIPDADSPASRWIAIDTGAGIEGISTSPGTVFMEIQVDTTGFDASMVQIVGLRYAVDNRLNEIFVNGVSVWTPPTGFPVGNEFTWGNVGDIGQGAFQSGVNTIRFAVENTGSFDTPLAFRMEATVATPDIPVPPVAVNDSFATQPGQALNVSAPGVLGNDSDANGDPITAIAVSQPSSGTLTLNSDGSFDYTPQTGFSGTDSFTYMADDGGSQSNVATVTIDVSAAPVAADDAYQVQSGQSLGVNAPGVLANDSDADGDPITAVLVSGPGNAASFALLADGSFSYTPNAGFIGTDTFTYTADDGGNTSNTATVTIDVTPDPLECLDLLRGPADAYEALAQNSLTQQIPAIQALLSAGDLAGATALQQSTINTLVQEAGNAAAATQAECANCVATLQANGNADLIPTVNNACVEQTHRIGTLQASATAELESVITPASPAPIAMLMRDRYTREISVNTQSTAVSADRYADRYTAIIHRFMARGNTAAADGAAAQARVVLQRSTAARAARIQQLCDNFVTRAARMPGTHLLIAEVTAAANAAMAELRAAENAALQEITAARAA